VALVHRFVLVTEEFLMEVVQVIHVLPSTLRTRIVLIVKPIPTAVGVTLLP